MNQRGAVLDAFRDHGIAQDPSFNFSLQGLTARKAVGQRAHPMLIAHSHTHPNWACPTADSPAGCLYQPANWRPIGLPDRRVFGATTIAALSTGFRIFTDLVA